MNDTKQTKKQLIEELAAARARIVELEAAEAERKRAEEALVEERNLLQALIDNVPDRIYAKDTESRFIVCNKALVQRMRVNSLDDVVGKTDFDFVPPELAAQFRADEERVIQSGQPVINREEPIDSPDGRLRWNLATKVPLRDSQGEIIGIVGIGREITEIKLAELALERRALQLQTAAEVSQAASSVLDPDKLIQQVVDLVRERFDFYYVGLFLPDEKNKFAVLRAGTGAAGPKMLEAGYKLEIGGQSLIGQCITRGKACLAPGVGEEAVRFDNPLLPETCSELALPLISRGQVIGAMTIHSTQEAAFSQEDVAVLQIMADQLANALKNAWLFENTEQMVEERTRELRESLDERERLQQEIIKVQQQALQELSTPIIPVMERIIVMPLIGGIDSLRAKDITRALLVGIREQRAKVVILDITGVPIVDSGVANHLNQTIQAARLKGAHTIITGVSDAVAETFVDLGIDWSGIETLGDLQTGLLVALDSLGIKLTK
ncbi:MAG: PAS domain-containing protein [Anaerolineae bacterium]|nr:PAS domain-containing protein [Anaerolineae bacterium]